MIKKIKKQNRGPAPYEAKGFRSGFVILFAVTISAILLSIALGVTNIAFREIKFSTSVKDSNDAFFAADTGIECASFNDKSTSTVFRSPFASSMPCLGGTVTISGSSPSWNFILSGLGPQGKSCAKVTVDKTNPLITTIISNGYNNGGGGSAPNWTCTSGLNTVERQIELNY